MSNNFEEIILAEVAKEIEKIILKIKEEELATNNKFTMHSFDKINEAINTYLNESTNILNIDGVKIENIINETKEKLLGDVKDQIVDGIVASIQALKASRGSNDTKEVIKRRSGDAIRNILFGSSSAEKENNISKISPSSSLRSTKKLTRNNRYSYNHFGNRYTGGCCGCSSNGCDGC